MATSPEIHTNPHSHSQVCQHTSVLSAQILTPTHALSHTFQWHVCSLSLTHSCPEHVSTLTFLLLTLQGWWSTHLLPILSTCCEVFSYNNQGNRCQMLWNSPCISTSSSELALSWPAATATSMGSSGCCYVGISLTHSGIASAWHLGDMQLLL